eukprot:9225-Heterococcus_DN1.PRE.2
MREATAQSASACDCKCTWWKPRSISSPPLRYSGRPVMSSHCVSLMPAFCSSSSSSTRSNSSSSGRVISIAVLTATTFCAAVAVLVTRNTEYPACTQRRSVKQCTRQH